ncbi:unnamed protein product [Fraxinus pennsylvanica]|uniref:Oleosin n=1 Tax=Fraxinus pennsylvanica TaxID=56036 RepID=A0AAD2A423_9LAMI|nr:unnamed protein product [Fraxinus pennsylvanica]
MAERDRPQPHQVHVHSQSRYDQGGRMKSVLPKNGPSTSQVLAVVTLLPVGGSLLALAGLTLVGSFIGLAVTTPLFIIFSPVLVPAAILVGLAVTAFLTSGAFGLTGLSSLSWVVNFLRQFTGSMLEQLEPSKRRMADTAMQVGQKTKETGQTIQQKAQEGKESTGGRT